MEDYREERAIHSEYGIIRDGSKGSYVYVMYEGHHRTLNFVYDASRSLEDNEVRMRKEILENYIEPVRPISWCQDITDLTEGDKSKSYSLVLFQAPRDFDDEDVHMGKGKSYYVMTELARRERFLFPKDDMDFFWIENLNCASKYVKEEEDLL